MQIASYLTSTLMVVMLLSGCLAGDEGNETSPQDFGGGPFGANETSPSPSPAFGGNDTTLPSSPPTANLTADVENGSAPLDVNFTIAASDPDGDLHSWILDFGDGNETNGTDVPEDPVGHTYDVEGNYTANLTVVDAKGNTASASVNITVEAGASMEPLVHGDNVDLSCTQCSTAGTGSSVSRQSGIQGIDAIWIELPPEAAGAPYTVESSAGDPDIAFWEECLGGFMETVGEDGPESGQIPEGAGCLMAWEWIPSSGSTITITVG